MTIRTGQVFVDNNDELCMFVHGDNEYFFIGLQPYGCLRSGGLWYGSYDSIEVANVYATKNLTLYADSVTVMQHGEDLKLVFVGVVNQPKVGDVYESTVVAGRELMIVALPDNKYGLMVLNGNRAGELASTPKSSIKDLVGKRKFLRSAAKGE